MSTYTNDVTATLKDGRRETGTLTHTWTCEFVLTKADGSALRFRDYAMLEFPMRDSLSVPTSMQNWRLFLSLGLGILAAASLSIRRIPALA